MGLLFCMLFFGVCCCVCVYLCLFCVNCLPIVCAMALYCICVFVCLGVKFERTDCVANCCGLFCSAWYSLS
jgi:hypothetical protein